MQYTYSAWDGSQEQQEPALELILGAMADDLLSRGSVEAAMLADAKDDSTARDAQTPGLQQMLAEARALLREECLRPEVMDSILDREQQGDDVAADRETRLGRPSAVAADTPCATDDTRGGEVGEPRPSADGSTESKAPGLESAFGAPAVAGRRAQAAAQLLDWLQSSSRMAEGGADFRASAGQSPVMPSAGVPTSASHANLASRTATRNGGDASPDANGRWSTEEDLDRPLRSGLEFLRRVATLEMRVRRFTEAQSSGDFQLLDTAMLRGRARTAIEKLGTLVTGLEAAGYIANQDGALSLTARGLKLIGDQVLRDTFRHMRANRFGDHPVETPGMGAEMAGSSRRYQHGDPFVLDINRTVMNAVVRAGKRIPVRLAPDDFEVVETESASEAATVLLLDASRSMAVRGCFLAAKKVVLALERLAQLKFPRDHIYLVVFSDHARQARPEVLHHLPWGDRSHGTNMQHGLMLARRLLGQHRQARRQIFLVTDGEPTAYVKGGQRFVDYPPTQATESATFQEVQRCTREGIVLNTFMLAHDQQLIDFVHRVSTINGGRVFLAAPERLGEYLLLDYVRYRGGRVRHERPSGLTIPTTG